VLFHLKIGVKVLKTTFYQPLDTAEQQSIYIIYCNNVNNNNLNFLLSDVDMHSAYLLQQRGWVSVTAGILSKRL